ncbi:MAG: 16S rRNA (cytosine(1402)-N(4))-methyltransferase, partial [Verrucomicrobiae bacterium]|nr:16S rRNA (cytosine(1402)-N(4))-methyltransferase [Verrucomicrobiae bacterium]
LDAVAKIGADPCRVIVVSYHSLEDRVVKHRFRSWKQEGLGREVTRKPLIPTEAEIEGNYKARSAKLRVFRLETEGEGEYGN